MSIIVATVKVQKRWVSLQKSARYYPYERAWRSEYQAFNYLRENIENKHFEQRLKP